MKPKTWSRFVRFVLLKAVTPALLLLASVCAAAQSPGSVDLSFNSGSRLNGEISALVVQPDGKAVIAGTFTTLPGAVRNGLARLESDGSVDPTFNPDVRGGVSWVTLQPDGKLLISGSLTNVGGTPRKGMVRLNADGTLDESFDVDPRIDVIPPLLLPDGKFLTVGTTSLRLARLNSDGSLDTWLDTGPEVGSMPLAVQPDGKPIIAGSRGYEWDHPVYLSRLNADGTVDETFSARISCGDRVTSAISVVAFQPDGKILVGGQCGLMRLHPDGSPDTSFGVQSTGPILSIAVLPDGRILAGAEGAFRGAGQTRRGIARLNTNGSLDPSFDAKLEGITPGDSPIGLRLALQPDGKVLIRGLFISIHGISRNTLARLNSDGTLDTSFDLSAQPSVGGTPLALALQPDGKVLVGGYSITRLNADGSPDASFDSGTPADRDVLSVALQPDGKILVGGGFNTVQGVARNRGARLNPDGSLDTGFDAGAATAGWWEVADIAVLPDGKVVVAGSQADATFSNYTGKIARLNPDGSLDPSFDSAIPMGGSVVGYYSYSNIRAVALQPDGKILIAGDFAAVHEAGRNRVARLNADGSLDSTFDPRGGVSGEPLARVNTIATSADGKVVIGGRFTHVDGVERSGIARLNADGSPDRSFDPGTGVHGEIAEWWEVASVAVQPDGKVVVGGRFTHVDGVGRNGIARLNADGSLDTSFDPGTGTGTDNAGVFDLVLQPDGKVVIGGPFSMINGIPISRVARLHGAEAPPAIALRSPLFLSDGLFSFTILGGEGRSCSIEVSSDLANWTELQTVTPASASFEFIDPNPGSEERRFYRLKVED